MKRIVFYTLAALTFLSVSCDPEKETTTEITAAEAKVALVQTDAESSADIVGITQSEGIEGLQDFFNLIGDTDPFSGRSDVSHEEYRGFIKKQTRLFRQIFNPKKHISGKEEEASFDFEGNKGIYDWKFILEKFVRTGDSDYIILNFPTEASPILNGSLRITEFEEVLIIDDFDEYYQPTRLAGDLTIDDELVIDADMTVAYNDFGDPISGDMSLLLVPYTFSLVFDDTASASSSLSASISKDDETIVGIDITVTFESADKEDLNTIAGSVQYGDLTVQGNVTGLDSEDEDLDPNDFVNLEVYQNDQKLGDIIFIEELNNFGDIQYAAYIEYSDGTTESLEDLFENTVMEIEDFIDDLEDWG